MLAKDCLSREDLEARLEEIRLASEKSTAIRASLAKASHPEIAMAKVQHAKANLSPAANAAGSLTILTEHSSHSAGFVAGRINSALLLAQRATEARQYVDSTLALKRAIADTYSAMDSRDWERAATAANIALELPRDILNGEFASKMVPTSELPDPPAKSLQVACDDMAALFAREFEKATESRNMDELTRYFKLFPLIGHSQQGLKRYSRFIRTIISGRSRSLLANRNANPDEDGKYLYGVAMARLFENIATILSQHAPLIIRHYGPEAMNHVVEEIQNEVDAQSGLIVDTWWDERRLDRLLAETKYYSYPTLVAALASGLPRQATPLPEPVDLTEAANALGELSMMLNRWSLYRDFVNQRWQSQKAITESALTRKVSSLLAPAFGTLAVFVFRRSVEKAIELDELPPSGTQFHVDTPLVSSLVDDTLYVLSTLLDQVVESGNSHISDAVLPSFLRVMESDYCGILQRKLRDGAPNAGKLQGAMEQRTESFLIYLNNLASTADYIRKIIEKFKDSHPELIVDGQVPKEFEKLYTSYARRANDIIAENVHVLFTTQIAPQLRAVASLAFKGTYMMTPAEPESNKSGIFEMNWRKFISPYSSSLHPGVYNQVMDLTAALTSKIIEKWIWILEGKVNELGTIALERDVSRIITIISESDYGLRDKFQRVAQIVTLISEEDEDIVTVLSEADIAQARKIRV